MRLNKCNLLANISPHFLKVSGRLGMDSPSEDCPANPLCYTYIVRKKIILRIRYMLHDKKILQVGNPLENLLDTALLLLW